MLKFSLLILLLIPLISTQAQPTNRIYGSYFGGSGNDWITSSAVHADGTYAVGGNTNAGGLPTTPNAFQQFYSGAAQDEDAFIAIFNPDHTLKYCSYFGGIGNDKFSTPNITLGFRMGYVFPTSKKKIMQETFD